MPDSLLVSVSKAIAGPRLEDCGGCFAPDDHDICDDTQCWCQERLEKEAKAAIEAVRKHDRANQWQPIETAPPFKTILTMHRDDLFPQAACLVAEGDRKWWIRQIEGPEDEPHSSGWNEQLYQAPTHWMPLPEGPGE